MFLSPMIEIGDLVVWKSQSLSSDAEPGLVLRAENLGGTSGVWVLWADSGTAWSPSDLIVSWPIQETSNGEYETKTIEITT